MNARTRPVGRRSRAPRPTVAFEQLHLGLLWRPVGFLLALPEQLQVQAAPPAKVACADHCPGEPRRLAGHPAALMPDRARGAA